jgi:hypothetical protein
LFIGAFVNFKSINLLSITSAQALMQLHVPVPISKILNGLWFTGPKRQKNSISANFHRAASCSMRIV